MSTKALMDKPDLDEQARLTKILTMKLPWAPSEQKQSAAKDPSASLDEVEDLWDNVPI